MDETTRKLGESLAGVIKAVVRETMLEREEVSRADIRSLIEEELDRTIMIEPDWPTDYADQAWDAREDLKLGEEWGRLIAHLAKNHHRTFGSIKARISQKIFGKGD